MNPDDASVAKAECGEVAQMILRELFDAKRDATLDLAPATLRATAVYVARCLHSFKKSSLPRNGALPVSTIAEYLQLEYASRGAENEAPPRGSVFRFCRELPVALEAISAKLPTLMGKDAAAELTDRSTQWRTALVYSTVLHRKYKDLFNLLFNVETDDLIENKVFRFGWLMFVVQKSKLLHDCPELSSCFHLLLCVCNFLLVKTPESFWRSGLRDLFKVDPGDRQSDLISLRKLALLNKIPSGEWKDLEDLMTSSEAMIVDVLNTHVHVQSPEKGKNLLDPEKQLLDRCIEVLSRLYAEHFVSFGECDERLFLEKRSFEKRPSGGAENSLAPPVVSRGLNVRVETSTSESRPPTSLESWIVAFGQCATIQPSERLAAYIESCSGDHGAFIQAMLWSAVRKVFPNKERPQELSQEALLGVKMFYHALDSLLETEHRTQPCHNLASVLAAQPFLLSVMACAFEILVVCLRKEHLLFPSLLTILQLKAFEFSKMVDIFLHAMPGLPTGLRMHLMRIDERIVESMAWQPGSSVYHLIMETAAETSEDGSQKRDSPAQGPFFRPPQHALPGLSLDQRSPSSAFKVVASSSRTGSTSESSQTFVSPRKEIKFPESLGPASEVTVKPSRSRIQLEDFFRKLLKLAAIRLMDLKSHLDFRPMNSNTIMLHVYKTLKCALYEQTSQFYNRHLDQMVLCALYGVCKVHQLKITFREIVRRYKEHRPPENYRNVILRQTNPGLQVEERSDIIDFYNTVFVTRMEPYLLTCCGKDTSDATAANDRLAGSKVSTETDEEPLSCECVAPWLISDAAHLMQLLKKDRHPPPPDVLHHVSHHQASRAAVVREVTDGSRSSGVESEKNLSSNDAPEHLTKRPRF